MRAGAGAITSEVRLVRVASPEVMPVVSVGRVETVALTIPQLLLLASRALMVSARLEAMVGRVVKVTRLIFCLPLGAAQTQLLIMERPVRTEVTVCRVSQECREALGSLEDFSHRAMVPKARSGPMVPVVAVAVAEALSGAFSGSLHHRFRSFLFPTPFHQILMARVQVAVGVEKVDKAEQVGREVRAQVALLRSSCGTMATMVA